jgi:poly(3-hydroxybutyrate) depolymerase
MKIRTIIIMVALGFATSSCRDRAAEKKIAELESRLAQLEGNKTTTPAAVTPLATTTTPAAEEKPTGPLPVIEFGTTDHDFGTVAEGQKVSYTYAVKNTGAAPLIIQNAQPSCGCTVPDWTKTPIPVGGTGFVKAEFDTHGKSGIQNKTITVTSNSWPKTTIIKFKAMVTPKHDGANGPVK